MKRKSKIIFLFSSVFIVLVLCSSVTVSAAPEDYINNFIDGISSAIDNFRENNNNSSSSSSDTSVAEAPTEDNLHENSTSADYYDDDTDEATDYPYYIFPTEPEEDTEQSTDISQYNFDTHDEDEPDKNYEYSYEPPTEEQTEVYEPEVLTETYTDPPFLERFSIADTGEGNLFVALGLWLSIIIGVIIVTSVVISTHRRKKGK